MLMPQGSLRVLVATKPVDFRKGMDGLLALVKEHLGEDPFSGAIYVFRAKRADHTSFCIPFAVCYGSLSLAPVAWEAPARSPAGKTRG
jgi:transposase